MPNTSPPPSRRDRQRQTREAIVLAAREAFATQGYHEARLEAIAQAAGFSKGAVYSNFSSKAELFLAAMDKNIADATAPGAPDPFPTRPCRSAPELAEVDQAMRGFALATMEFIAVAARDEELLPQATKRVAWLTEAYRAVVEQTNKGDQGAQEDDETLSPAQVGALMAALDQGAALLSLAGSTAIDQGLLHAGMLRLLGRQAAHVTDGQDQTTSLHHVIIREQFVRALAAEHGQDLDTTS